MWQLIALILQVTCMRLSELLELKQKDLAPSFVPLLPRCSIVVAAYETGVLAKTEVRDGSVFMYQSCFRWVNKLLPKLKCGNMVETKWNFHYLAAATLFQTATDGLGLSGLTMYPARRRSAGFSTLQEVAKRKSMAHTLPRPLHKLKTRPATCRGIIDKTIPSPAVTNA